MIELGAPAGIADFSAMTLPVGHDLEIAKRAIGVDTDRIGDQILPADDFIDEHVSQQLAVARRFEDADGAVRGLRPRRRKQRVDLLRRLLHHHFLKGVRVRIDGLLSRIQAQIIGRGDDGDG